MTQHCSKCDQEVEGIGPWCRLYNDGLFAAPRTWCEPLRELRRRCFKADSEGDGPLVNGICWEIRRVVGDEFVP